MLLNRSERAALKKLREDFLMCGFEREKTEFVHGIDADQLEHSERREELLFKEKGPKNIAAVNSEKGVIEIKNGDVFHVKSPY